MNDDERAVQLHTLEYQQAAERYHNIYRSIWTIFSYMTAVAGGFLAFGAERIEPHALICIASFPLLFWLVIILLPAPRSLWDASHQASRPNRMYFESRLSRGAGSL